MAIKTFYPGFTALTGGTAAALDSVDGNSLLDGDVAITIYGGDFYCHILDADSGASENPPAVIAPDTNAGTKRWIRAVVAGEVTGLTFGDLGTGFSLTGGTTPKTLSVPATATLPGQDTGTAAPTTGTWALGWIRWNTTPTAGGNVGWICVQAGPPGNWSIFGPISG